MEANTFNGIDTSLYDSITLLHLNSANVIKGTKPEILKKFYPMPVPVVIAVRCQNNRPYYSFFQQVNDKFEFLSGGVNVETLDDGSIILLDVDEESKNHIYKLELGKDAFYSTVELFKR